MVLFTSITTFPFDVGGITFFRYAQNQEIGKPTNLKFREQ
jgi:hypothetical protein